MSSDTVAFCNELAGRFTALAELLEEHVADYDEILPHVFIADVSRHVLKHGDDRTRIVSYLDECFRERMKDIGDLIAVSFVEQLESSDDVERALSGVDADALREEWRRQRSL